MNRILLKPNPGGKLFTAVQATEAGIKQLLESGQAQLIDAKTLVYKMTPKTDIPHTYAEEPETKEAHDPLDVAPQTYETRELRAARPERSAPTTMSPAEKRRKRYQAKAEPKPSFEVLSDD